MACIYGDVLNSGEELKMAQTNIFILDRIKNLPQNSHYDANKPRVKFWIIIKHQIILKLQKKQNLEKKIKKPCYKALSISFGHKNITLLEAKNSIFFCKKKIHLVDDLFWAHLNQHNKKKKKTH